ncbi:MAG: hypothetical protein WAM23_02885, partial [Candidatus Acidiferrales bacterium]
RQSRREILTVGQGISLRKSPLRRRVGVLPERKRAHRRDRNHENDRSDDTSAPKHVVSISRTLQRALR